MFSAMQSIHPQDSSSSLCKVAHDVSHVAVRDDYFKVRNRLQKNRVCLHKTIFKRHRGGRFKGLLGRVNRMIRTVQKNRLHTDYRIPCQRSFLARFLNSFLYSGKIIFRYCTAEHFLFKAISFIIIEAWRELHYDISILPVPTGLFLVLALNLHGFLNGLSIGELRLLQENGYVITVFQTGRNHFELLFSYAIKQTLPILRIRLHLKSTIFFHHSLQSGGQLILIRFILCTVSHICIGNRQFRRMIQDRCIPYGNTVPGFR